MKTLVIVASGLHLGYVGCYGNEWVQTPTLDRLATEGIVFDQHYADQPDAMGAERAWQTGCYRFPWIKSEDDLLTAAAPNLFPLLAEHGVATILVSDEQARLVSSEKAGWRDVHLLEQDALMSDALAKALIHLVPHDRWLLRFDLHALLPPWNIPEEFHNRYLLDNQIDDEDEPGTPAAEPAAFDPEADRDLAFLEVQNHYAAAVTYLDTALGQILHELEEHGLLEETLVFVTSDHGLGLGEDALRRGSSLTLHEELIHIPLIMRFPGKAEAGRRVDLLTQPIDLLPTLFDAFGLPLPAVHGQSLLPLTKGDGTAIRAYACAGLRSNDRVEWALRSADWYFLRSIPQSPGSTVESELYVKPDDRWEVNNVRQHHLEFAERLEQTLGSFIEATRQAGPLRPPELPKPGQEPAQDQQDLTVDLEERSMPQ